MKPRLILPLAFVLVLGGCDSMSRDVADVPSVEPRAVFAAASSDSNVVLLDVRTVEEFEGEGGHLEGAILIPLEDLDTKIEELKQYKEYRVIPYCRSGRRSAIATAILREKGFDAVNMDGGMLRWKDEGLPVVVED